MADGRRLSGDERPSIAVVRGEFTLDIPVGPMRKLNAHRCHLRIVPPLVRGELTRIKTGETVRAKGFFARRERRSYLLSSVVEGELTLVLEKNGAEAFITFDTDYWGSPSKAVESLKEAFSGWRSDDLLRHLARIVVGAERDLAVTQMICAGFTGRDGPQDLLRHAEELWNQARLLLLLGDAREADSRAVSGADRLRRSGLAPGTGMAESGGALAYVLDAYRRTEAAGRVRDAIGPLDATEER